MEEEDRSDVGSDDNIASQTVLQNLELLTTTLQSYFRSEIAIVSDDIGKQSAAVKILLSAAKETAREMKDLKVLLTTMRSESISSQRRTGHSGSKRQRQLHSRCRLLHRHHLRGQSGNARGLGPRTSRRSN